MNFENFIPSEIGPQGLVKLIIIVLLGIFLGLIIKYFIKQIGKYFIYPHVRKSSPSSYKSTVSGVNLTATIVQWIIISLFVIQALSIFKIYLFEEILRLSIAFIPKIAIAFLIFVIGLIITNIFSRRIRNLDFRKSDLIARAFEIIFISATVLSALEVVGIRLTAFIELFKISLYTLGIIIAITIGIGLGFALKPQIVKFIKEMEKK
jgi:hypothetical protein